MPSRRSASLRVRRVLPSNTATGRPVDQSAGDTVPLPPVRVRKSIFSVYMRSSESAELLLVPKPLSTRKRNVSAPGPGRTPEKPCTGCLLG